MESSLKIVKIDHNYCDYLRKFDPRVMYNAGMKDLRPFVGVLFNVGKMEYFAPLSSSKEKHLTMKNTLDVLKISNGKLGIVNFNNMIPVMEENYVVFNLNDFSKSTVDYKRFKLLQTQYRWLIKNEKKIRDTATNIYKLYTKKLLPKRVVMRCCDFTLLEEKCLEYAKVEKEKIFC